MFCSNCGTVKDESSLAPTDSPAHLLTSNVSPLDSELSLAMELLEAAETRISVLNSRIAQLVEERDKLVARVAQYKQILSPVRRVPGELLCEIFAHVHYTQAPKRKGVKQPPWFLGHVCRAWRDTALGCSSLWRSLDIFYEEYFTPYFVPHMIKEQLRRAGNAPLAINFEWLDGESLSAEAAWDLLLPVSNRWESLRIKCFDSSAARIILNLLQSTRGRLACLEKVEFLTKRDYCADPGWDLFLTAPRLRHLLLTDDFFKQHSPGFDVPWSQITRYRGVFALDEQLKNLRSATNLVDCSIGFDDNDTDVDTMVSLRHLHRLRVEHNSVLANLTAPSLHDLLCPDAASAALLPFVQRSACRLTALVLTKCSTVDGLVPFLTACSSLEQLVLDVPRSSVTVQQFAPVLYALHVPDNSTSELICANLAFFAFGCPFPATGFGEVEHSMSRMIQSRSRSRYQLRSVRLSGASVTAPCGMLSWIQRLKDDGLDIKYVGGVTALHLLDPLTL